MVNLRKIKVAFLEDYSGTMVYQIHSPSLQNCHFYALIFLSNGRCRHLGLHSRINLKRFHLQTILSLTKIC